MSSVKEITRKKDGHGIGKNKKEKRRNLKKKKRSRNVRSTKQQDITDFILNLSSFLEDSKKPPSNRS